MFFMFPMLCTLKPCFVVGSCAFDCKADALFFGSYVFFITNQCFLFCSYAFDNKANAFSFVPMLVSIKPALSILFICFSH